MTDTTAVSDTSAVSSTNVTNTTTISSTNVAETTAESTTNVADTTAVPDLARVDGATAVSDIVVDAHPSVPCTTPDATLKGTTTVPGAGAEVGVGALAVAALVDRGIRVPGYAVVLDVSPEAGVPVDIVGDFLPAAIGQRGAVGALGAVAVAVLLGVIVYSRVRVLHRVGVVVAGLGVVVLLVTIGSSAANSASGTDSASVEPNSGMDIVALVTSNSGGRGRSHEGGQNDQLKTKVRVRSGVILPAAVSLRYFVE